jgi:MoxR-like ATPase
MSKQIYRLWHPEEFRKAGPSDLMELRPVPGQHPLYFRKAELEVIVYAIVENEPCHISGPTGTAKSSLIEALYRVPENFFAVASALDYPKKPLRLYPIQVLINETPGELYQRRALKDGTTYDEKSGLVQALEEASRLSKSHWVIIWLRELGRVHSSSVQGGLLDMMTRGDIVLPDGSRIAGDGISWIADSNYQAENDSTHTLVVFDTALKRRFSINITLDYLPLEQESLVVREILKKEKPRGYQKADEELVDKVVLLGHAIRRQRDEGNLHSAPPPTIAGYLAFLRMAIRLRHLSLQQVAMATLLGHCSREDSKQASAVLNEVFGLQAIEADDPAMGVNLF